jgi:hypothetical protein
MISRLAGSLALASVASVSKCGAGVAVPPASTLAGFVRRVARRLAAWQARARSMLEHGDGWETVALEHYLRRAGDVHDLERRQRTWDRDEVDAYRLSGWL